MAGLGREGTVVEEYTEPSEGQRRSLPARLVIAFVALVAGLLVAGNVAILVTSALVRETTAMPGVAPVDGVKHLHAIDRKVWRGSAPSREGYEALAARGVTTVVDLRAEADLRDDQEYLERLGVELVRIPVRDGQSPSPEKVEEFLDVVRSRPGLVFLHFGAGVGRTGTMAAAYAVSQGDAGSRQALRSNFAVGPPSLEQIVFVASIGSGDLQRPGMPVRALSRVLDAPRRLWSRYGL